MAKRVRCYVSNGVAIRCGGPVQVVEEFRHAEWPRGSGRYIVRVQCDLCGEAWDTSNAKADDYIKEDQ